MVDCCIGKHADTNLSFPTNNCAKPVITNWMRAIAARLESMFHHHLLCLSELRSLVSQGSQKRSTTAKELTISDTTFVSIVSIRNINSLWLLRQRRAFCLKQCLNTILFSLKRCPCCVTPIGASEDQMKFVAVVAIHRAFRMSRKQQIWRRSKNEGVYEISTWCHVPAILFTGPGFQTRFYMTSCTSVSLLTEGIGDAHVSGVNVEEYVFEIANIGNKINLK
jgi:hypothetical protein